MKHLLLLSSPMPFETFSKLKSVFHLLKNMNKKQKHSNILAHASLKLSQNQNCFLICSKISIKNGNILAYCQLLLTSPMPFETFSKLKSVFHLLKNMNKKQKQSHLLAHALPKLSQNQNYFLVCSKISIKNRNKLAYCQLLLSSPMPFETFSKLKSVFHLLKNMNKKQKHSNLLAHALPKLSQNQNCFLTCSKISIKNRNVLAY